MVQVGDAIPSIVLSEGKPDNQVHLDKELAEGKGLVIGVPAAFSPTCSDTHIPDYLKSPSLPSAGKVFVVSVNDAFVMNAWGKSLDPEKSSGIRFLADAGAAFTKAWGVDFDASSVLGGVRSKRYAIRTENGKVSSVHIEPDNTGLNVSAVQQVLA
ncbi:Peroxisomal membrane associated protein 20 [Erysiphe necator]|uniref:Putative tsa family protein n=1 Tax=Uncinula necator TaxID=52586 RepID=A0A0B1PE85_UNCNE|nr:Peroxisomal membrane associated protein 20 [Erysiphe necator]KHJ34939.1 putative tsa family protein [Erysiphe necator]